MLLMRLMPEFIFYEISCLQSNTFYTVDLIKKRIEEYIQPMIYIS
jgi:hypothetical protein